jgi:hypothetical protein
MRKTITAAIAAILLGLAIPAIADAHYVSAADAQDAAYRTNIGGECGRSSTRRCYDLGPIACTAHRGTHSWQCNGDFQSQEIFPPFTVRGYRAWFWVRHKQGYSDFYIGIDRTVQITGPCC